MNVLDTLQHLLYSLLALTNLATRNAPGTIERANGPCQAPPAPGTPQLRRVLGIWDLAFMIVGTVIGSGIFLVPGPILRAVHDSVPQAFAVWLGGGVLSLFGALTYGELSSMKPEAGGLYVFIHDAFGPFLAFLFGWTLFFVISSGSIATLAVAFGNYLGEFVQLSAVGSKVVAVLVILVIAAVNVRGTRQSADLLNVTTLIKVLAILAVSLLLLWRGTNPAFHGVHNIHVDGAGLSGFGLAMISVLWAYEGWQYATFSAGETVNAQRVLPRAFFLGTASLMAIYFVANFGYLAALGAEGVAASNRVAASALGAVVSHGAGKIVAIAILISMFSAANSIMLNAPRAYYAMAKDGLFFRSLSRIHPRFQTPATAIVAAALWSAILSATGTFEQLLTYVVFIGWVFYALAAASVFVYRKRQPDATRPYRVPGYPWTPGIFIAAAIALVCNTIFSQPLRAAIGLGIVFVGAPAYLFWRHSKSNLAQGEA